MNCPVCDERMREVDRHGVNVDVCPSCNGIWLDKGELEKLLEISSNENTEVNSSDHGSSKSYERHDDHDHQHRDQEHDHGSGNGSGHTPRKKKASWLGDILGSLGGDD